MVMPDARVKPKCTHQINVCQGTSAEVMRKVIQGERPEGQLTRAEKSAEDRVRAEDGVAGTTEAAKAVSVMAAMVRRCWRDQPAERPEFATIREELEREQLELYRIGGAE